MKCRLQFDKWADRLGVLVGASLIVCSIGGTVIAQISRQPQFLPVGAKLVVGKQVVMLEIARTPIEQAKGLSHRQFLPPYAGMLFPVSPVRKVEFWMKDVKMPLDAILLHQGRVVAIASHLLPCQANSCQVYKSDTLVDQFVELPEGTAHKLELAVGMQLSIQPLPPLRRAASSLSSENKSPRMKLRQ